MDETKEIKQAAGEPSGPPPGWPRLLRPSWVSIVLYLVLAGLVFLVIWRLTGYQPLQMLADRAASTGTVPLRAFHLLASYEGKVYYFDRQAGVIWRYDPAQPDDPTRIDSLRSFESIVPLRQGEKLALISAQDDPLGNVYVLDLANPSELKPIVQRKAGITSGFALTGRSTLAWSPRGDYIAFVAYKNGESDLFVVDATGINVQRLTYLNANIGTVTWVDDDTIAYVSDWEGQDNVYLIDKEGGNLRRWQE